MASRRSLIVDAIVDALGEITTGNGWPLELIAQHALQTQNTMAGPDSLTRHRAYVMPTREIIDLQRMHSHAVVPLAVTIEVCPAPANPATTVHDAYDPLLTAVVKRLLQGIHADPPFGVAGVEAGNIQWDAIELERSQTVGATITLELTYRHDVDDPENYGGP